MTRIKTSIIVFFFLQLFGCTFSDNKSKSFYNTFSQDWDLLIIPIVEPYMLTSTDNGASWHFREKDEIMMGSTNGHRLSIGQVQEFGVSENIIFGKDEYSWFLFDLKTKLFAHYQDKTSLLNCLNSFHIPITSIKNCKEYQNDIKKYEKCYWYPPQGKKYTTQQEIQPNDIIVLDVSNNDIENVKFKSPPKVKHKDNGIYFFKLKISDKKNDLLYFGINWTSSILIEDEKIIPIFIDTDDFNITLYTPYPVAQTKGIAENKRIHIKKKIHITKE